MRRITPAKYITLSQEQEEEFVRFWENLYTDEDEGDPPGENMLNPPPRKKYARAFRTLKRKKLVDPTL